MIYVILGMHKSGTTLISQILHKSGINMGEFDESVSYDQGNKYERHSAQEINRIILGCGNAHSLDVIRPVTKPVINMQIALTAPELINRLNHAMQASHANWGFKDPRTCLTYPVWAKYLPDHKVIYVFRDPLELWYHYRKYIPKRKVVERSVQGYKALKAWHIHNTLLLEYLKEGKCPCHIVNYKKFMQDQQEMDRLAAFTGMAMQDCREKDLYRSKPRQDLMFRICSLIVSMRHNNSFTRLYAQFDRKQAEINGRYAVAPEVGR